MKKLLLFLCLCVATAVAAYAADGPAKDSNVVNDEQTATVGRQKMVEKGKTWWYRKEQPYYGNVFNYGVSIGDEVEIDGQVWNEVNVTLCGLTDRSGQTRYEKAPQTIGYIRETEDKLISRVPYLEQLRGLLQEVNLEADINYPWPEGCHEADYILMDWSKLNTDEAFLLGNEKNPERIYGYFRHIGTEMAENSGREYTVYELKIPSGGDRGSIWSRFEFTDGIGMTDEAIMMFYHPFAAYISRGTNEYSWPVLCYVTDPDGSVIYEGKGGEKLWESSGVEMPTVESREAVRWYNLQGVQIPEPHSAGIYIRREGLHSQKIKVE